MTYKQIHTTVKTIGSRIKNKASTLKARLILVRRKPNRLKSIVLFALVTASLITSLPIFPTTSVSAATMASAMSLEEQVQSLLYYRSLGHCVINESDNLIDGGGIDTWKRINQDHVKSYEWFTSARNALDGSSTPIGPYMRPTIADVGDDFKVSCDQSALVQGALTLWGNWAPDEALCAFGYRRADDAEFSKGRCTDAQNGTDEFKAGDGINGKYQQAVKNRVYGGAEPSLSAAANYIFYLGVFQQGCAYGVQGTTTQPTGTTDRDYAVKQVQADKTIKTMYYSGRSNKTNSENVIVAPVNETSADEIRETCGWVVDRINENADDYVAYLGKDPTKTVVQVPGGGSTGSGTTGVLGGGSTCGVGGIGWLICPIANSISGGIDGLFNIVKKFLEFKSYSTNQSDGLYPAWSVMRNFANVAFVIAFMIIIYSQLTSAGITNYGIKKMLPRLIVAAILVNVSYWICGIAVDISNILGASLNDLFMDLRPVVTGPAVNVGWENATATILAGTAVGGVSLAIGIAGAGSFVALLWMLVPLLATALFSILVAVIVLAGRQVLLIIFIVISPLAFVAYLLPNTQKWYEKWQSTFMTLLLMYPIIAVIFGGSQFAAALIRSADNIDMTIVLLSLAVQVIPLAITPLVIKFSGGLLNRFAGIVNNPKRGPVDGIKNWAKDRGTLATKKGLASSNPNWANRAGQWRDQRRRTRESNGKKYDNQADSLWQNTAQGQAATDALGRSNIQSEIDKNRAGARLKATAPIDLTLEARVSKISLDAAQAKEDTLVKAMGTNASNPMLDSLNPNLRREAQQGVLAKSIADSAGAMAQSVQSQEYAEKLRNSPTIAQGAGGIDVHGASKAVANAMNVETKASHDVVTAEKTTMRNMQTAQLQAEADNRGNSLERRLAASSMINTVSNPKDMLDTIDDLSSQLQRASALGDVAEMKVVKEKQQQFMEDVGGKLPMSISGKTKGEMAAGTFTRSSAADIIDTFNQGGYSGEKFANMSHHELGAVRTTLVANQASLDASRKTNLKQSIDEFNAAAVTLGKAPAGNIADPMRDIHGVL